HLKPAPAEGAGFIFDPRVFLGT
ncbi:MAG: hypothetical protein RL240_4387, partial [Planctomycetota bacterium]